jgi:hypothetical protein
MWLVTLIRTRGAPDMLVAVIAAPDLFGNTVLVSRPTVRRARDAAAHTRRWQSF